MSLLDERAALVLVERVSRAVAVAIDLAARHAAVAPVALPLVELAVAVGVAIDLDRDAGVVAHPGVDPAVEVLVLLDAQDHAGLLIVVADLFGRAVAVGVQRLHDDLDRLVVAPLALRAPGAASPRRSRRADRARIGAGGASNGSRLAVVAPLAAAGLLGLPHLLVALDLLQQLFLALRARLRSPPRARPASRSPSRSRAPSRLRLPPRSRAACPSGRPRAARRRSRRRRWRARPRPRRRPGHPKMEPTIAPMIIDSSAASTWLSRMSSRSDPRRLRIRARRRETGAGRIGSGRSRGCGGAGERAGQAEHEEAMIGRFIGPSSRRSSERDPTPCGCHLKAEGISHGVNSIASPTRAADAECGPGLTPSRRYADYASDLARLSVFAGPADGGGAASQHPARSYRAPARRPPPGDGRPAARSDAPRGSLGPDADPQERRRAAQAQAQDRARAGRRRRLRWRVQGRRAQGARRLPRRPQGRRPRHVHRAVGRLDARGLARRRASRPTRW